MPRLMLVELETSGAPPQFAQGSGRSTLKAIVMMIDRDAPSMTGHLRSIYRSVPLPI